MGSKANANFVPARTHCIVTGRIAQLTWLSQRPPQISDASVGTGRIRQAASTDRQGEVIVQKAILSCRSNCQFPIRGAACAPSKETLQMSRLRRERVCRSKCVAASR